MNEWDVFDMVLNIFLVLFLGGCVIYSHIHHEKFSQVIANWFSVYGRTAVEQLGATFWKPIALFSTIIVPLIGASVYRLHHLLDRFYNAEFGTWLFVAVYAVIALYISFRAFAIRICLAVRHNKG